MPTESASHPRPFSPRLATFFLVCVGTLGHRLWSIVGTGPFSDTRGAAGFLASSLAVAPLLLVAMVVRWLVGVRMSIRTRTIVFAAGLLWCASCLVSLVLHRGFDLPMGDFLMSIATLGEWNGSAAGLEIGRTIWFCVLLSVIAPALGGFRASRFLPIFLLTGGSALFLVVDSASGFSDGGPVPLSLLLIAGAAGLHGASTSRIRLPFADSPTQAAEAIVLVLLLAGFHTARASSNGIARDVLALVLTIAILLVWSTSSRSSGPGDLPTSPLLHRIGFSVDHIVVSCAVGVIAFGSSTLDLIGRQHVERSELDQHTGRMIGFLGPRMPTFLWATISSALLGILIIGALIVVVQRSTTMFGRTDVLYRSELTSGSFTVFGTSGILALAFWIRLATLLTVAPTRTDGGDPLFYHVTANLLAQGRGLPEPLNFIAFQRWIPSALHGPAYPIVLSLSSRLGGTTYFDHKFLSVLIGTAIVGVTMLLTWRIAPPNLRRSATLIAGFLTAVYPNLWLVDSVLFPEGLMALLTVGVVLAAYGWWARPTYRTALVIGSLLSASALTRGEGLLLSALLVVPLMLGNHRIEWRRRWMHLLAAGLACVIVLAPWSLRNARSFEVFVPLSTNGNELFVYANCPPVYEGKFLGFWLFQCQEDLRATLGEPPGDEAEKAIYWREQGLQFARNNIGDLPRVLTARVGRQWELFRPWQNTEFAPIEGRNKDAARLGLGMYYSMIPLAVIGAIRLRRSGRRLLPIGAVFVSVTLTAAYAYGTTRFRAPFEPLMCLLAAIGVAVILARLRRRWTSSDENRRINLLDSASSPKSFVEGASFDMRRVFHPSGRRTWLAFSAVAAAIAVALPALYTSVGSSMEEGFMLVFPELVNRGFVPNVDFLHLYGPGSLYSIATFFRLFGTTLEVERTFGLLQHIVFISGLMVLVRPWGRAMSAVVGATSLLFVLTPIGLQALAWNGALALGIWSIVLAVRASHRSGSAEWVASGVLAGLALTFRPDVAVALLLGVGFLVWKRSRRAVLSVLAGLILGLAPFWIHVGRAGPRAVVDGMFIDPVFRLRGGRELPRPPSLDRLDGALQVISEKFAPWWGFPHLSAPKQLFIWFFLLPLVAFGVLLIARAIPTFRPRRDVLVAAALFGVGLLPQALQRPDSAHFLWVAAVSWPLGIVALYEWSRRRFPRRHPRVHLVSATAGVLGLILLVVPFYTIRTYADLAVRSLSGQLDVRDVRRGDRHFHLGDERPWRATLEVVAELDSRARAGERLFVGPVDLRQTAYSDAFFYHLFPELDPATYYIEMDPGIANQDDRLADDVKSADWLVLTRFWSGWIEPNDSIVFGSDLPNQVVESSFCLVGSYQNDLVRLYRRCAVGDGIGPYEGPYRPEFDYAVEVLVPVPPRPDGTCTPTCRGMPSISGVEIGIDTSVVN